MEEISRYSSWFSLGNESRGVLSELDSRRVFNFGNFPLVGPVTSILVLPIMPTLMTFGFLSSIVGIFSNVLGWIFSMPAWFLLYYFIKILDIFSQPWMSKTIQNVSWIWLVIYYFILGFLVWFFNKKYSAKFL